MWDPASISTTCTDRSRVPHKGWVQDIGWGSKQIVPVLIEAGGFMLFISKKFGIELLRYVLYMCSMYESKA